MPEVPHELFMKNIATAVRENADLVPPAGMGSLYLRPILFGSGPGLGVSPSPEYHFMTYVSPVGEYFSGPAATQGARMKIEREHSRAARNGKEKNFLTVSSWADVITREDFDGTSSPTTSTGTQS